MLPLHILTRILSILALIAHSTALTWLYPDPALDSIVLRLTLTCSQETYPDDTTLPACSSPSLLMTRHQRFAYTYDEAGVQTTGSFVVDLPRQIYYINMSAPEGVPPPEQWASFIDQNTKQCTSKSADNICKNRVKCWLSQQVFSKPLSSPYKEGEPKVPLSAMRVFTPMEDIAYTVKYPGPNVSCVMCLPAQCPLDTMSCPNGFVPPTPIQANDRGVAWEMPRCTTPCPSGTWLTCYQREQCTYPAPRTTEIGPPVSLTPNAHFGSELVYPIEGYRPDGVTGGYYSTERIAISQSPDTSTAQARLDAKDLVAPQVSTGVYAIIDPPPAPMTPQQRKADWIQRVRNSNSLVSTKLDWPLLVGSCYPCRHANALQHYGETILTVPPASVQRGFLSFNCPGGATAPTICPLNMGTKIKPDNTSGACHCMDGFYKNANECSPCPAGFKCAWVGDTPPTPKECELDYYAWEGFSECKKCARNTAICTTYQALTRCQPHPDHTGEWQTTDSSCVSCQECQQVSTAAGARPCYRVTAIFNQTGGEI